MKLYICRNEVSSTFPKETLSNTPVTVHIPRRKEPEAAPSFGPTPTATPSGPPGTSLGAGSAPPVIKRTRGRPPGSGRAAAQAAAAASAAAAAAAAARSTPPSTMVSLSQPVWHLFKG